jgi:hypothetical protein
MYVFLTPILNIGEWSASSSGRFTFKGRTPVTLRMAGRVSTRTGMHSEQRIISHPCRNRKTISQSFSPYPFAAPNIYLGSLKYMIYIEIKN